MAISIKIDPIGRDVEVILQDLSPDARRTALADFARTELRAAQEKNQAALGRVPTHETVVDGRRGAPIESAKADGTIVFEFDLVLELFGWISAALIQHSPKRSGRYVQSHVLLADGREVMPTESIPEASEYVFVNAQPYARKIERGLSRQAPDGVYQVVAALAAKRFGNVAKVRFGYRSLVGVSALDKWATSTRMSRLGHARMSRRGHARAAARDEWLRRQPAVVVTI